jgi:hypothetical protein
MLVVLIFSWYLYQESSTQFVGKNYDLNRGREVVSKLNINGTTVIYLYSYMITEEHVMDIEVIRLEGCKFLDRKNWDCFGVSRDESHAQRELRMLNGKLSISTTGDLDQYLILPWGKALKI